MIGILKTSEKAKSNSVYPRIEVEKCLSFKKGEKVILSGSEKRVFSTAVIILTTGS